MNRIVIEFYIAGGREMVSGRQWPVVPRIGEDITIPEADLCGRVIAVDWSDYGAVEDGVPHVAVTLVKVG